MFQTLEREKFDHRINNYKFMPGQESLEMFYLQVWEAVGELNSRSTLGRSVVNPPEKRSQIKPHITKDAWYLCKCGRAFSEYEKYDEHRIDHQSISFKQTWIDNSTVSQSVDESSDDHEDFTNENEYRHVPKKFKTFDFKNFKVTTSTKSTKSPLLKVAKNVNPRVSLRKYSSNKKLRSSAMNLEEESRVHKPQVVDHHEKQVEQVPLATNKGKRASKQSSSPINSVHEKNVNPRVSLRNYSSTKKLRSSAMNLEEESRVHKPQVVDHHEEEQVEQVPLATNKGKRASKQSSSPINSIFYDAVVTRTRSKGKDSSPPPPIPSPTGSERYKKPVGKIHSVKISSEPVSTEKTTEEPKSFFDCTKCGLPFKTTRGLLQHDKWYHAQPIVEITCKICPAKFTTETDLQKHMVNHSIKLMYKKFKFGMNGSLSPRTRRTGVLKEEQPSPASSEGCSSSVIIKSKINSGDKCGYCGQIFFDRTRLWPHLKDCRGTKT